MSDTPNAHVLHLLRDLFQLKKLMHGKKLIFKVPYYLQREKNYLHWIEGRANVLCKCITHIFSILGMALAVLFLCFTSICMSSKTVSYIFKILFQTGYNNIFVLRGVFFSGNIPLKSSFSDEKTLAEKFETTLIENLSKNNVAKYNNKIPSLT